MNLRACGLLGLWLCGAALAAMPPLVVDGDADGVSDESDDCLYTPPGIRVNAIGCPLLAEDGDVDGVADTQDVCPYTPPGATVDAQGCALDPDFDGIALGIDRCEGTVLGEWVNESGCGAGQQASPLPVARPLPRALAIVPAAIPESLPAPMAIIRPSPLPSPMPVPAGLPELVLSGPTPVFATVVPPSTLTPLTVRLPPATVLPTVALAPLPAVRERADATSESARLALLGAALASEERARRAQTPGKAEALDASLRFPERGSEITSADRQRLQALAPGLGQLARRSQPVRVELAAFADRREGAGASSLAIARVERVRTWLIAQGVPPDRIRSSIRVLDEGEPAANRRVDLRTIP